MIIATALGNVIQGKTIKYNDVDQTINFHYGDQKELLAWINLKNKAKVIKYPLVWYVLNTFTEYKGWYETDCTLVIMQNTESTWFNPMRQDESYTRIIEPTWQVVKNALKTNQFIQIMEDLPTQFELLDKPNYGIDDRESEPKSSDIVDARIIKFKLRIKAQCLINTNTKN